MTDKHLLRAISEDRALGSEVLFGHGHTHKSPDFHVEMVDLWRCADELVLIEAFRMGAKSTKAEEFLTMEGAFGNFHYCLVIGETYAKACQRLESIAHHGTHNTKLRAIFGRIFSKKPIENKIWFNSGAFMEAIGWEQEIRSFKHLDHRPDRAYMDDVENLERVRDTEAVDASVRKFWTELVPAMDKGAKIRFTQTPLATDCMVTRFRQSHGWVSRSFPICNGPVDDPKTVSAWPDRYPMQWIREKRDIYAQNGMLRVFEQEYMLNVESTASKPFSETMLRYIDLAPAAWLPRVVIYDPSRTANEATSDRTGKVVISRMGSKIIVHESGGYFWKPDEIRSDLFNAAELHHAAAVGIEKNSLDDFLMQPIRYEMLRRGVLLPIKPLQAPQDRDKDQFIMGLHPFFAGGDILLVGGRGNHAQLVAEILNFPGGRLDILNALAYGPRMFAGSVVYDDFSEANVAPAPDASAADTVYACWNAKGSDLVLVALMRKGRHLMVLQDWAGAGPLLDVARTILTEFSGRFHRARTEHYVPADLHDNWRKTALVPALKDLKLRPYRAEHTAIARGALAERLRTQVRERRCLTVDRRAVLTLNALAGSYKYPILQGGKQGPEPEESPARLAAEAVETLTAILDRGILDAEPGGSNYATNAQGVRYHTALPNRR